MHSSSAAGVGKSGNSNAYVLLLTGPAGAGKSAAAERWASRRATQTAHLPLDVVRYFLKSGYASPADGWSEEVARQLDLARRGCAALARLYVEAGISCVVDDAIFPEWEAAGYGRWEQALGSLPHALVVLMPSLETALARNASRTAPRRLFGEMIRTIYELMLPWREQTQVPMLDNSTWSVEETADALQAAVRDLRLE